MSSLFRYAMMSPVDFANPRQMASLWPLSRSLVRCANRSAYGSSTSIVPSVDPPSITMYSNSGYRCRNTLRTVHPMNRAWLYDGVTMLMRGTATALERLQHCEHEVAPPAPVPQQARP